MAGVYWSLWVAALVGGAIHFSVAFRRYRRWVKLEAGECGNCGYPKAAAASRCPECGRSYAIRGMPRRERRAVVRGLMLVGWPLVFALGLNLQIGNFAECMPNSILFVLAEHFSSEPALRELDERVSVGHARWPEWLAPSPGQREYATLCGRILASPHPTQPALLFADKGLSASVNDDQVVAEVVGRFLESESAEVRSRFVELLEAMHATAPTRWEMVVTADRRERLLDDRSLRVRLNAARMFWRSDEDARATAVFEEALETKEGRAAVLHRLNYPLALRNIDGRLGPGIVKALREHPDQDLGLEALQNSASISDETLHEVVRVLWEDDEAMASYHRILVQLGPRASVELKRLRERLNHDNDRVRGTAAMALGAIGDAASEAVPDLERMVREDDSDVAVYGALTAVSQIAGDRAYALAIHVLEETDSEFVQKPALEIIAIYGAPGDIRACNAARHVLDRADSQRVRDLAQTAMNQVCRGTNQAPGTTALPSGRE
jgi:HEAT repeat protein